MSRLRVNDPHPSRVPFLRRKRVFAVAISVLLGTLVGTAAALFVYRSTSAPPQREETERPVRYALDEGGTARALRQVALEAMERGDYELALEKLNAALKRPQPPADIHQLMSIAKNLLEQKRRALPLRRAMKKAAQGRSGPPARPTDPRPGSPKSRPGVIQVRTNPPRLVVEVNGRVRDVSPARIEVEPGRHVVTVVRDNRRLLRRKVFLKPGKTAYIDADLTDKIRPAATSSPRRASVAAPKTSRAARQASGRTVSRDGPAMTRRPAPRPPAEAVPSRPPAGGGAVDRASSDPPSDPPDGGLDRGLDGGLDPPDAARPRKGPPLDKGADALSEPRPGSRKTTESAGGSALPGPRPGSRKTTGSAGGSALPGPRPGSRKTTESAGRSTLPPPAPVAERPSKPRGKIPTAAVREVIERQGRRISSCYNAQLQNQLGLAAGRVVIKLLVAADGSVKDGRIHKSTLKNSMVVRCIQKGIRELKFPAPKGGAAEVTFAMTFGNGR